MRWLVRSLLFLLLSTLPGHGSAQFTDNVVEIGSNSPRFFAELLDVEVVGTRAYVTGVGGFVIYDILTPANIVQVGRYVPPGHPWVRFYQSAIRRGFGYAAERRDGLFVIDMSIEARPSLIRTITEGPGGEALSFESLAIRDNTLYAATHSKGVRIYDILDPSAPVAKGTWSGDLTNPWTVGIHDSVLLVADGAGGLVLFDLADKYAPEKLATVPTTGTAQDVVADGNLAFVAVGAFGVEIFDISDPAQPVHLSTANTLGPAAHIAISDGYLYVASWELLEIYDVRDPANPTLVATEDTPGRTMAVAARASQAFVADWFTFRAYEFNDFPNPDIRLKPDGLDFGPVPAGVTATDTLYIQNVGRAPLQVTDVSTIPGDFTPQQTSFTVDAGTTYPLPIEVTPQSPEELTGAMRVDSDDPDQPVERVAIWARRERVQIGQAAPDFELFTLGGELWRLSDHIGQPILLAWFASW